LVFSATDDAESILKGGITVKTFIVTAVLVSLIGGGTIPAHSQDAASTTSCPAQKKRVAVLKFGATGKFGAFEGWDVGDGLAAQLATALQQNGCFTVIDRLALAGLLREQELALTGIVAKESAVRVGRLSGAQILVKGEITEFEPTTSGSGMTVGLGFIKVPLGIRLGGESQTSHVAMDVRLIDASTGQVLQSHRVEGKSSASGFSAGLDNRWASIGGEHFTKTPLGQATRQALTEAVGLISRGLMALPSERAPEWRVVEVMENQIYVNAGEGAGLKVGERLRVVSVARELVDPDTQAVLGTVEQSAGEVEIIAIKDRYSVAAIRTNFQPKRGDAVRY
jgi:curli biogenesis system outer membrane secretion channel CsgG